MLIGLSELYCGHMYHLISSNQHCCTIIRIIPFCFGYVYYKANLLYHKLTDFIFHISYKWFRQRQDHRDTVCVSTRFHVVWKWISFLSTTLLEWTKVGTGYINVFSLNEQQTMAFHDVKFYWALLLGCKSINKCYTTFVKLLEIDKKHI